MMLRKILNNTSRDLENKIYMILILKNSDENKIFQKPGTLYCSAGLFEVCVIRDMLIHACMLLIPPTVKSISSSDFKIQQMFVLLKCINELWKCMAKV